MDWIHLAEVQELRAGTCEHDFDPSGSIKYWKILEQLSD
jgi:hypothetical protein